MAKRIKRVDDLPEWFNLAKYAATESLDAAGWYEQLSVRRELCVLLGFYSDGSWPVADTREVIDRPETLILEHIRATPIVDVCGDEMMRAYFYDNEIHELKTRQPHHVLGVRLSSIGDLYMTEHDIEREKRDYARKFFAQFDDPWEMPHKFPCPDWIDEPVDAISNLSGWNLNVRVNMQLPDKMLIEQFERLLKDRRAQLHDLGIPGRFSLKSDFSGWHKFRVLPYLDLKIWEHEAKASIPNRVMADAIFPAGEGGEEVVRKTTAKLAVDLMIFKPLIILAAIAAQKIAEQNAQ